MEPSPCESCGKDPCSRYDNCPDWRKWYHEQHSFMKELFGMSTEKVVIENKSSGIIPSCPCHSCPKEECEHMCAIYKAWFKHEWAKATDLFKEKTAPGGTGTASC